MHGDACDDQRQSHRRSGHNDADHHDEDDDANTSPATALAVETRVQN